MNCNIYSLANKTPCAIATIRISGKDALKAVVTLFGKLIKPYTAQTNILAKCKDSRVCVITWWPCPRSPTGEDYAEVSVTGHKAITNAVISTLAKLAFVQAAKGEFLKRAIANKRATKSEVLALAKIFKIRCNDHIAKSIAKQIGLLATKLEAQLNFGTNANCEQYKLKSIAAKINQLKTPSSNLARVCIIGEANVGKSSLFNAITMRKRAIVSSLPGTTRDAVSEHLATATIIDTAGFKRVNNKIEKLAAVAAWKATNDANALVILCQAGVGCSFVRCKSLCTIKLVVSKSDLIHRAANTSELIIVSAYTLEGVNLLKNWLYSFRTKTNIISDHALLQTQKLITKCALETNIANKIRILNNANAVLGVALTAPTIDNILDQLCIGK
ncbi:MAG: GTPase [Candidatus Hodgkinia cicadicola]